MTFDQSCKRVLSGLLAAVIVAGCAFFGRDDSDRIIAAWDERNYAAFVRQNMAQVNKRYTQDYTVYEFVVDLDGGSTRLQDLIDPDAASETVARLGVQHSGAAEKVERIMAHLRSSYIYTDEPEPWLTARETLVRKRGDCKNLSVLVLSMLVQAGVDAYGAISNGHMWVCARYDGGWHVLETDAQSGRKPVYAVPGFYELPLYIAYPQYTLKRIRR